MKILFYNHYHNGDLFVSKEFIRHIMQQLPNCEFGYYHNNNPKTIRDLLPYYGRATQSNDERFILNGDTLTINTWIGKYIPGNYKEGPFFWNNGINYVCLSTTTRKCDSVFNQNLPKLIVKTFHRSAEGRELLNPLKDR